jgi:hypothetical protein
MVTLTQTEILEVLINLGITSVVDLKTYSKEYALYFNRQYPQNK